MPYCRKCGAQLDEDARFCRNCGAPVQEAPVTMPPPEYRAAPQRRERKPYRLPAVVLIGILLVASLAVITLVPFVPVDSTQSLAVSQADVSMVNLDFATDVADVNVFIRDLPGQLVSVDVAAKGAVGIFASNPPVKLLLSNETAGQTMTVTGEVSRRDIWPMSLNLKVSCDVYLDPSVALNLSVRTDVGEVSLVDYNDTVNIQELNLQSTTGNVELYLRNGVTLMGNVSATTTTGIVDLTWRTVNCTGDRNVNIASTTGLVRADILQTRAPGGNIALNVKTTTGNVDLSMMLEGDVGANITSKKVTGSIGVDVVNFDGNQSPITSGNYPAANNFEVNLGTTTGNINIVARYNASAAIIQEETEDLDVIYALPLEP